MGLHQRLFAATYDLQMAAVERAGLHERRSALLSAAAGRVLEIGAGTGRNVALYPPAVTHLVLAEPSEPMAARLRARVRRERPEAQVVVAAAESLPVPEGTFDAVVATLVLCTVRDPALALAEIHRALRPGGRLLFLEHVRSLDPGLARWQDRLAPAQRFFGCGCNLNRPTPDLIDASPLTLERVERGRLPRAPAVLRPLAVGVARAA